MRASYPDIPRRVSGYNLDSLLGENDFNVAQALTGSEGTLATLLRAEVVLVPLLAHKELLVIGYDTIEEAADAVPLVSEYSPLVVEGFDERLIHFEREKSMQRDALDMLPPGQGWLMVQLGDDDADRLDQRVKNLTHAAEDAGGRAELLTDPDHREQMWAIRESGLGATARAPDMSDTWPGFEDSAVPPDKLGEYLRDFGQLLDEFGFGKASRYGHFGHGCLHIRIPFTLKTAEGIASYKEFLERAARLVTQYGGSLSGEHGDGQQRGALLPIMYGDRIVDAFRTLKLIFDPAGLMNPGKVIDAYGVDENLRLGSQWAPREPEGLHFGYPEDDGSFNRAVLRCVGVGQCRSHESGVMCPSYRATGEEEHSTRGRSRLLFEMMTNHPDSPIQDGWKSHEVRDSLDLCLACKGCKSDCPVDVDMATYKVEFMSHYYARRLRPMAHYSIGWIPRWAQLAAVAPRMVNAITHAGVLGGLLKRAAGIEPDRPMPTFAPERFVDGFRRRGPQGTGELGKVMLWPDTFSNNLHPHVAHAAVEVLEAAGYEVIIPERTLCCGLTLISTGQLGAAKKTLRRTVDALAPHLREGGLVVGLEPSCTAVFRSDAAEMFPHDEDVARLRKQTRTLAELLSETPGWKPPRIERGALVQPHCHHHAVMGEHTDQALLDKMGVSARSIGGCCGLAGNFGYEKGHLDVSIACAQHELLPALDELSDADVVLADGFSCRTQVEHLGSGRQAMHLAELLAGAMADGIPDERPENKLAARPAPPEPLAHKDSHLRAATRQGGWPV